MPEQFDAYHRWLGIPPSEQPPSHYRLLGLVDFESDVEVIRDAAERQIAHVRVRALKHPELSQKILNELAMAKLCLLNPESKAAYDKLLRKIAESKSTTMRKKAAAWAGLTAAQWGIVAGVVAGMVVVVAVSAFFLRHRTETPDVEPPPEAAVAVQEVKEAPEAQKASGGPAALPMTMPKPASATRPPQFAPIADQFVEAGKPWMFKPKLAYRGTLGRLCWKLVEGSECGASIDVDTGFIKWTPKPDQAEQKYRFTVEVAPENAKDLVDRTSFHVEVRSAPQVAALGQSVAGAQQTRLNRPSFREPSERDDLEMADFARSTAGRRKAPPRVVDLGIRSPSGRTLTSADWNVDAKAASAAKALWSSPASNVIHVNELVRCEYNVVTNKLDGRTVTLHQGIPHRCETFVEYRQGNRHGVLATWDAQGNMVFWGEYERDKCHEFCCLFQEDQPRIVLVCDHGKVLAVHIVSEGKVVKSFASEEDALHDEAARPLLEQVKEFESRYNKNEVALRAEVKRIIQSLIGQRNAIRRDAALSRINERGARQKAGAAAVVEEFRNKR